jgi:ubiquitin-protein ligase
MRARRLGGQPTPSSTVERDQAMRNYKLSIEYKHLKSHCPGGVFIVPSFDDVRLFHGVIFIRRGAFNNGIFKFTLTCPPKYNDANTHPKVVFSSYVYNPHVHPKTGEVDMTIPYPEWKPDKHFLVTALTYIKKIFYIKDFSDLSEEEKLRLPNQEAYNKFLNDQEGYRRRVAECVKEAQRSTYTSLPGSTIRFAEEDICHQMMRNLLAERFGASDDEANNASFDSSVPSLVTKEGVLEAIQQAQAGSSPPKSSSKIMPRTPN